MTRLSRKLNDCKFHVQIAYKSKNNITTQHSHLMMSEPLVHNYRIWFHYTVNRRSNNLIVIAFVEMRVQHRPAKSRHILTTYLYIYCRWKNCFLATEKNTYMLFDRYKVHQRFILHLRTFPKIAVPKTYKTACKLANVSSNWDWIDKNWVD